MSENDAHAYCPHIGIASGPVIVGYAGTALRYNVSVFGAPVALAARCAGVGPAATDEQRWVSSTIVMPGSTSGATARSRAFFRRVSEGCPTAGSTWSQTPSSCSPVATLR